jgi:hypothetical protein
MCIRVITSTLKTITNKHIVASLPILFNISIKVAQIFAYSRPKMHDSNSPAPLNPENPCRRSKVSIIIDIKNLVMPGLRLIK